MLLSAGSGIGFDEPIAPPGIAAVISDVGAAEDDTLSHDRSLSWLDLREIDFIPTMLAGDATGTPPDSPTDRVDPNTVGSPFAGVGSVKAAGQRGTGAAVSSTFILTAAHLLDQDGNGTIDLAPNQVSFRLNYGGDLTHIISSVALYVHPEYTGFANPSLNDDLALVELASPLPVGVPIYPLQRTPIALETTLTLVGYGRTGYGDIGDTTGSSFTIKRVGQNNADIFAPQDDAGGPARDELVFYDFDGPAGSVNVLGGGTLGNDIETMLAPGDSGGPAFLYHDGEYHIAATNTFTQSATVAFDTLGGGMLVHGYAGWIDGIVGAVDINDNPPVITPGQTFNVAEDVANTTSVGTVLATDIDTVGTIQDWAITAGNADGIFTIDPASGEITIADNTNLDYEVTTSYVLTLAVGDGVNT